MKLENKTYDVVGQLGKKTTKASLSEQDVHKLWAMIENPYKNPISSIVREYTSNCFDSHVEAGVDDAVTIKLGMSDSIGLYISFTDVGVGLSPDRMENVFLKIMKSTKENTDHMVGAFGLGSKSGLSYTPIFYMNTHFDGITYKYQYRKDSIEPVLDLLQEYKENDIRNGSSIIIPIANEHDLGLFVNACWDQLYYFKNVVFNIDELENVVDSYTFADFKHSLYSDYKMYDGKSFKVRIDKVNAYPSWGLHIANGPVKYPIDHNNIKIPGSISYLPIALKFDIGELDIIQTREDVRYTDKTIKAIQDKVEDCIKELETLYGTDTLVLCKSFKEYRENFNNPAQLILGKDDYTIKLDSSLFFKRNYKLNAFYKIDPAYHVNINLLDFVYDGFSMKGCIKHNDNGLVRFNSNFKGTERLSNSDGGALSIDENYSMQRIKGFDKDRGNCSKIILVNKNTNLSVKINKQIIVKEFDIPVGHVSVLFVDNTSNLKLHYYKRILGLSSIHKKNWRAIIKLYQSIVSKYIASLKADPNIIQYEHVVLDNKWYETYSKLYRKSVERDNTKINYIRRHNEVWNNENLTFDQLLKLKGLVIYTEKDNKNDLMPLSDSIFRAGYGTTSVKRFFIALASRNYNKLKEYVKETKLHNYYTMDEFNDNKDNIQFKTLKDIYLYLKYFKDTNNSILLNAFDKMDNNARIIFEAVFPELISLSKEIKVFTNKVESDFKIYNPEVVDRIITDIQGMEEFIDMKSYSLNVKINRFSEFYYEYGSFIKMTSDSLSSYSSRHLLKYVFNDLVLNITLRKSVSSKSLISHDLLRTPSQEEYSLLVDFLVVNKDLTEETIKTRLLINKFQIKNKLNITEWTF